MRRYAKFLAILAVALLSAPSALGVKQTLAATRGEIAGWLAAVGIELAYLSLAFIEFDDERRQWLAARIARSAVVASITLNVIADYTVRVPGGLSSSAAFIATFDWLLLALSLLESAPLAGLAYTIATLLHQQHNPQKGGGPNEPDRLEPTQTQTQEASPVALQGAPMYLASLLRETPPETTRHVLVRTSPDRDASVQMRVPDVPVPVVVVASPKEDERGEPLPEEQPAANPAPPLLSLVREVVDVTGDQADYVTLVQVYDAIRDAVGAINPTLRNKIARCLRELGATPKQTRAEYLYLGIRVKATPT